MHFLTRCKKLEEKRDYNLLDRNLTDSEDRMRKLLFRNNKCYEVGKMIKEIWTLRRDLLKMKQDNHIDTEKSKKDYYSKSDPGPQKRTQKFNKQINGRLSKG